MEPFSEVALLLFQLVSLYPSHPCNIGVKKQGILAFPFHLFCNISDQSVGNFHEQSFISSISFMNLVSFESENFKADCMNKGSFLVFFFLVCLTVIRGY